MLNISFYDGVKYGRLDFINRDLDFFGNGCVNLTDFNLAYPVTPNMTLNVGAGTAWVDGYRIANDPTLVTLTVAASSSQPRIDIIQIGHDDINKQAVIMVKQGVPGSSPIEPGADAGYVKLYAINVGANVTSISSSNVIDRRALVPLKVSGSQISYAGVAGTGQANTFAAGYTQTFAGPVALQAAVSLASGQTFTNSGTITGGVINASSAPWGGVSGKPTSISGYGIADNLVGSLTAGANIAVTNPTGLGAANVSITGSIPIANGGTGSSSQNFVDLTTAQTVGGVKTFSADATFNGVLNITGARVNLVSSTAAEKRFHIYNGGGVAEWLFGQKSGTSHDFTFSKLVGTTETDYFSVTTSGDATIVGALTVNGAGGSFANSKTSNGYQKLPGGLIIQWGSIVTSPSGAVVTFPIAFPTSTVSVCSTPISSSAVSSSVNSVSLSGVTVYSSASATCYWMAIGY